MSATGWTPEFRLWVQAYVFDHVEDASLLADLDAKAVAAGNRERRRVRSLGCCSECGRPLVTSELLAELLVELDRDPSAAASMLPGDGEGPGSRRSLRKPRTRGDLVGAKTDRI